MMCQWKIVKIETKKYQRKTACIPIIGNIQSESQRWNIIVLCFYKCDTNTNDFLFLEKEISTFTLNVNDTMCLPKYFHAAKEIGQSKQYICKCSHSAVYSFR